MQVEPWPAQVCMYTWTHCAPKESVVVFFFALTHTCMCALCAYTCTYTTCTCCVQRVVGVSKWLLPFRRRQVLPSSPTDHRRTSPSHTNHLLKTFKHHCTWATRTHVYTQLRTCICYYNSIDRSLYVHVPMRKKCTSIVFHSYMCTCTCTLCIGVHTCVW